APTIASGASSFEVASVGGASDSAALAAFELKVGDRLLLQPPEPRWTTSGSTLTTQQAPQVVKVKKITRLLGRLIVEIDKTILHAWTQPVAAYRINRTFRHFGHNAPGKIVTNRTNNSGTITGARQSDTGFERHIVINHLCPKTSCSLDLPATLIPLDSEVQDLQPGMRVIVQTLVHRDNDDRLFALSVARRVTAIEARTIGFGNLNGSSTLLTLNLPLLRHAMTNSPLSDVRHYRIHEVTSPRLTLRPVSSPKSGAFANGTNALRFWGIATEVRAIAGRRLYLSHGDSRTLELVCTNQATDFVTPSPDVSKMWALTFDRPPAPFVRADFDEAAPTVTVFGSLVDASQGKAEQVAVLGNGDNRQMTPTLPLPKLP